MTEAVTEDAVLGGRVTLRQPREGFRVGIDSILLAAAMPVSAGESVLDLGAGVGAAAICLAHRIEGCKVMGIEVQPSLVHLATENIRLNGLERRVDIMVGDLLRPPPRLIGGFDHVMANPPHIAPDTAGPAPNPSKAAATMEGGADLKAWLAFALAMFRPKGSLTMIHRADRLDHVMAGLSGRAGAAIVYPLWPGEAGKPAKRVIVRARKGIDGPLTLMPGLVLHQPDGAFTAAAEAVLRT